MKLRKNKDIKITFNLRNMFMIVCLFSIVMVCLLNIVDKYKVREFIVLQTRTRESVNYLIVKDFQPKNISNIKTTVGTNRNVKYNSGFRRNKVMVREKSCFYLSWGNAQKNKTLNDISLSDFDIIRKDTDTNFKRTMYLTTRKQTSQHCKRFLTIGSFGGRMGNQMFRIAAMLGEAYRSDIIPVIPKKSLLNKYMDLPNVVNTDAETAENVYRCNITYPGYCAKTANTTSNIILYGVMQSWKYFEDIRYIIKNTFNIKRVHIYKAKAFIANVTVKHYQNVCIHVRLGDFLSKKCKEKGCSVADVKFIERAKEFFIKKYLRVQFIVLSTSKTWCRKNINNIIMSPFINAGDDMALMSMCDHVIVTSGTFGWWGAWLSGGTTVYFKGYPVPGSQIASVVKVDDYYPIKWVGM